jgi:general secretion pathway protein D
MKHAFARLSGVLALSLGLASVLESAPAFAQDAKPARGARAARATRAARAAAERAEKKAATKAPKERAPRVPAAPPAAPVATPPVAAPPAAAAAAAADRPPPGDAGQLPTTMDKIAQATDVPFKAKPGGHLVKFNLQDADLAELVNHISGLTGKRFIYGAKVRQIKATVVSPEPVTLNEAYQAFLSILEVNGMTVVPEGRFLKIIDSAGITNAPTPIYSRGAPVPEEARFVTRLYRLQNVSSEEVVAVLNKFKSKEGDVTAYGPGQLLIITDTGPQVTRMIRIIEEIDIGGSGQRMWIEPVQYGTADEMAKRLNELFDLGAGAGQPGGKGGGGGGGGLARVVADPQTNSLIVVGTEESYLKLLELLKRLDTRQTDTGRVQVLPLQHAVAKDLAQTLSQMLGANKGQPGAASTMFEGEIQVTADQATNSLVITSTPRDYAQLRLVIDRLDQPRRQVFIEAVIMDVSVSDTTSLGVSSHGGSTADLGGGGDSLLVGGFNAGRSVVFPADLNALQGFAAGLRGPDLQGTSNLFGTGVSIPAFGVVLNALASSGKSNVLATPHIIATDNVLAEINIGENIPLQTNVGGGIGNLGALLGGQGGQNQGASALASLGALGGLGGAAPRQDVGNRIKVTPHINESNQVRLEIEQESSAPGAAAGALGAVSITRRTANTTVVVEDQQTVVIGGLMKDEYVTSREKVPVLGDIPVLGFLFRSTKTEKRKANLLLILTPHVIREQADLRRIFERKMEERQEFLDRYFVFESPDWQPPKDWSRTNGLIEDIRQAYTDIEEQLRLELESMPASEVGHQPSEPIELPEAVRAGGTSIGNTARSAPAPAPAPATAPGQTGPAQPATPPQTTPTNNRRTLPIKRPSTGRRRSDIEPPVRINPIARSVNEERVE